MSRICTICARAGSQGVKGKNLRDLAGVPLLAHSVRHAVESNLFSVVAISSDSDEILDVGLECGATDAVLRPAELASHTAAKVPAIRHCVAEMEKRKNTRFDVAVDLHVTAPLRTIDDIKNAIALVEETGAGNVFSVTPAGRSPYFNMVEVNASGRVKLIKEPEQPYLRRQDAPLCYDMNASIYVWSHEALFEEGGGLFRADTAIYEMPQERSLDIDTELDFKMVEFLFDHLGGAR